MRKTNDPRKHLKRFNRLVDHHTAYKPIHTAAEWPNVGSMNFPSAILFFISSNICFSFVCRSFFRSAAISSSISFRSSHHTVNRERTRHSHSYFIIKFWIFIFFMAVFFSIPFIIHNNLSWCSGSGGKETKKKNENG